MTPEVSAHNYLGAPQGKDTSVHTHTHTGEEERRKEKEEKRKVEKEEEEGQEGKQYTRRNTVSGQAGQPRSQDLRRPKSPNVGMPMMNHKRKREERKEKKREKENTDEHTDRIKEKSKELNN